MRSTLPHRRLWLQAAASLVAATTLPAGAQVRPKPTVDSAGYTEIRWDGNHDPIPKRNVLHRWRPGGLAW